MNWWVWAGYTVCIRAIYVKRNFSTDSLRSPSHFDYPCLLYNHIYIYSSDASGTAFHWDRWLVTKGGRVTVMHRGLELYTQIAIAIFRTKYSGLWTASLYMDTDYSSHIPPFKENSPSMIPSWHTYRLDNWKRNELYGRPDPDAKVDTQELANKVCVDLACLSRSLNLDHASFRYDSNEYGPLIPIYVKINKLTVRGDRWPKTGNALTLQYSEHPPKNPCRHWSPTKQYLARFLYICLVIGL